MRFEALHSKIKSISKIKISKKTKILICVVCISLLFFSQLFLNVTTTMKDDDFRYSFSFETGEKLTEFSRIIPSMAAHYNSLNGRTVDHFIAQFFLLLNNLMPDNIIWDVCNSATYIALLFLICYHIHGTFKKFSILTILLSHFFLWFFVPAYGESFYWLIGSCNYLWGLVIILLFMIPYTHHFSDLNSKNSHILKQIVTAVLFLPVGIIAGNTNENIALASIIMILLSLFRCKTENRPTKPWMFTGLIGACVGFLIIVASPGQQSRLDSGGGFLSVSEIIKNVFLIFTLFFDYFGIPILLLCLTAILVFTAEKKHKATDFNGFLVYFIGAGIAVFCMSVLSIFPTRVWTAPIVFSLIAFGRFLKLIPPGNKILQKAVCIVLSVSCVCFCSSYVKAYLDIKATRVLFNDRIQAISQALDNGKEEAIVKPIYGYTKYDIFFEHSADIHEESERWPNTDIARYYGIKKIINSESKEAYEYESNEQDHPS